MNKYLRALREHNNYKLFDDEMEEQMSRTIMADEIRVFCNISKTGNSWFTRNEALAIVRKLNKSAQFISNKKESHSYVPCKKIFEQYLTDIWTPQQTDNMHPSLINMVSIRDALRDRKDEKTMIKKNSNPEETKMNTVSIQDSKKLFDTSIITLKIETMLDRAKKIKISPEGEIEFWLE